MVSYIDACQNHK